MISMGTHSRGGIVRSRWSATICTRSRQASCSNPRLSQQAGCQLQVVGAWARASGQGSAASIDHAALTVPRLLKRQRLIQVFSALVLEV